MPDRLSLYLVEDKAMFLYHKTKVLVCLKFHHKCAIILHDQIPSLTGKVLDQFPCRMMFLFFLTVVAFLSFSLLYFFGAPHHKLSHIELEVSPLKKWEKSMQLVWLENPFFYRYESRLITKCKNDREYGKKLLTKLDELIGKIKEQNSD